MPLKEVAVINNWRRATWMIRWLSERVQFSSVTQSCPTLCDLTDCSTPGLPVHHQLPELAQTHVHRVSGEYRIYLFSVKYADFFLTKYQILNILTSPLNMKFMFKLQPFCHIWLHASANCKAFSASEPWYLQPFYVACSSRIHMTSSWLVPSLKYFD